MSVFSRCSVRTREGSLGDPALGGVRPALGSGRGSGTTRTDCGADPLFVLQASPSLTARALAAVLFETADPDRNQIQPARRRLDALVKAGQAICVDGHKGGIGGRTPTMYVASCDHAPDHADPPARSRLPPLHRGEA